MLRAGRDYLVLLRDFLGGDCCAIFYRARQRGYARVYENSLVIQTLSIN